MAHPLDALSDVRCMPGIPRFCLASGPAGPDSAEVLWDTFIVEKGLILQPALYFESEEDFFGWCSKTVSLFDTDACTKAICQESILCHDLHRYLQGLPNAFTCHHREGSFDELTPKTVAWCYHVANVISVSCFLFRLRTIETIQDAKGSVIDRSRLIDHLSPLMDKWKWSGDSCQRSLSEATRYFANLDDSEGEKEQALKLLYQWTILPLSYVFGSVKMDSPMTNSFDSFGNDQFGLLQRAKKWNDEVCNFLEEYRKLFQVSDYTEFYYFDMYTSHCTTAEVHICLGNHDRANYLLTELRKMLSNVREYGLMLTRWGSGKIDYFKPDYRAMIKALAHERNIWTLSSKLDKRNDLVVIYKDTERLEFDSKLLELVKKPGLWEELLHENLSPFDYQLRDILRLLNEEMCSPPCGLLATLWFSEARERFDQLDLSKQKNRARLRKFLEFLQRPHMIRDLCHGSWKWEVIFEKQGLLLDVCETLRDPQLSAKILQQYAILMMYKQLNDRYSNQDKTGPHPTGDISSLQRWLQEELKLQLTLPAPHCIQALSSCLIDPCTSDEHKQDLPHTLKAYRLLKRSVDIYSGLLHSWTEGSTHELDWLKLLESQKSFHELLLYFLLDIGQLCERVYLSTQEFKNSAVATDDGLLPTSNAPTSNHVDLHVYPALLDAIFTSALVWVERARARTLLAQLGPWYEMKHGGNPGSLKEELMKFDTDDKGVLCVKLGSQVEIQVEKLVDKFYEEFEKFCKNRPLRRQLGDDVLKTLHGVLQELYGILIEPCVQHVCFQQLDRKATIIFVPDEMLYRVPFALLRDENEKYLFQLHPIAIAPSLRVLQHCERRLRHLDESTLKPDGCILAVGNAYYKSETLPGTKEELEYLKSCFEHRVEALEEDEATRDKFLDLVKAASDSKGQHVFAFMHLGVHGHWSNPGKFVTPGIRLQYPTGCLQFAFQETGASKGPTTGVPQISKVNSEAESSRDGERRENSVFGEVGAASRAPEDHSSTAPHDMLAPEDIIRSGFQWRTRLVVLSACNSSRGQGYSDGELNLPRALMIAGVPASVVSQWKVSDVGAPSLMQAFYENLQCGQDVATALQSAMLQILNLKSESANNIFEWGPFVVWGLPTVQLPKDLWTKTARKTLPARDKAASLRLKFDRPDEINNGRLGMDCMKAGWDHLNLVETFLESMSCNALALEDTEVFEAIFSMNVLLTFSSIFHACDEVNALGAEFYALLSTLKQFTRFELERESLFDSYLGNFHDICFNMMRAPVMKGCHKVALGYANYLIKLFQNNDGTHDKWTVDLLMAHEEFIRQERAVVLRLMGKHDEALKEFERGLESGEDYVCLIQMSYLKHLMDDEPGALECAVRAKRVESPDVDKSTLAFQALPDEYRQWLFNVDVETAGASSFHEPLT